VRLKATAPTTPAVFERTSACRIAVPALAHSNWTSRNDGAIVGKDEGQRNEIAERRHWT
jgi:hypothetical protein